ncbi:MAG: ABC transporter ATP-binding protein [Chromatocurvus sp.]
MTLIEATDLTYAYDEGKQSHTVLRDITLTIAAGERVALLGRSGSGKSTLLNLLGGIDTPTSGTVTLGGKPMQQLREPELTRFRRRHIGYVYQRFNLVPTLTAAENIALPLDLAGASRDTQDREVLQWLAAVGLEGRGNTFPDLLSGGEQQRVAIARALIHRPALVLADEPTGSLDVHTGNQVLDLLLRRAGDQKQALLVVTHSDEVAARADRVLLLEDGNLHENAGGKPA